ncbi:MAG: hypothetical protein ABJE47_07140 [bacterium]
MPDSHVTRLEEIRADIHRRLREACAYMDASDFDAMVRHMAEVHFRYEQRRTPSLYDTPTTVVTTREPEVRDSAAPPATSERVSPPASPHPRVTSDAERERNLWVEKPITILIPSDRRRDKKGRR